MSKGDISRYQENWRDEVESAALYRFLAEVEADERLSGVYERLAQAEEKHARFWEEQLQAAGGQLPSRRLSVRTRVLMFLAKRFGPDFVLPSIQAAERADSGSYDLQPEAAGTNLPSDERSHARLVTAISGAHGPGLQGSAIARLEGRRHRGLGSGNALRAAVLGANDGLVSNFSLVMGVAGAQFEPGTILVTGLAGILAGAGSMAMGEWISVQSARELYTRQIATEKQELIEMPEEEEEELALIYEAKGMTPEQARILAARVMSDHDVALDTLSREELGIDPDELGGSAYTAAGTSFLLFAVGALPPVMPFAFLAGWPAIITSVILSVLGLFLIGAAITLFTGRGVVFSGVRQVVIGLAAAALSYVLGNLFGVALGG
jgi:VIT1/CCC1 family predicted Fe2+/Mn2+ transporter